METTLKEYTAKSELRKELRNSIDNARYTQDWDTHYKLNEELKELDKNYFDKLPTVDVSFMIGTRNYYRGVVKIGKSYFDMGRKMTKRNGYYLVEEIDGITKEMEKEMLADSYYY